MDEKRSVLGCALVHLQLRLTRPVQIFQHILTHGYRWVLILEDDFFLPPHFPRLLELYWRHAPPYEDTDMLYLGAGSNRKGPRSWIHRFLFRPQQTVGTHAYAVTSHGAEKLLSALKPLIQSIDSQIHETLLDSLHIFAFPSPDSPSSSPSSRPYRHPPDYIPQLQPFSFDLSEPHFFPSGSLYHGDSSSSSSSSHLTIVRTHFSRSNVAHDDPQGWGGWPEGLREEEGGGRREEEGLKREEGGGGGVKQEEGEGGGGRKSRRSLISSLQGRPAVFFRSPLDGDILQGPDVVFDFVGSPNISSQVRDPEPLLQCTTFIFGTLTGLSLRSVGEGGGRWGMGDGERGG
eukprot:759602-Hanusia_phi.AAC.2